MPSGAHGLDVGLGQLDPLLTAEQLQQDLDPLTRPRVGVNRQMTAERPAQDLDPRAAPERGWLGQVDKPAHLAPADLRNDPVRHFRRPATVHDQPEGAGRPTSGVPLQLDQHEGVAGKERRPILDGPTEARAPIPQPRVVGFISVQAQAMQRQRLTMRLEAAGAPIGHSRYLRAH
jgi:hypothetical protein